MNNVRELPLQKPRPPEPDAAAKGQASSRTQALTEALPVLSDILGHMRTQNAQMATLMSEMQESNRLKARVIRRQNWTLLLSCFVLLAVGGTLWQVRMSASTLRQASESVAQVVESNAALTRDMKASADQLKTLVEDLQTTKEQVTNVVEGLPKVQLGEEGQLEVEVSVTPAAEEHMRRHKRRPGSPELVTKSRATLPVGGP